MGRRSETGSRARALLGRLLLPGARLSVPIETLGAGPGRRTICPHALDAGSVVYVFGIGADLSFELDLAERFGVTIHAFDPTPRSVAWVMGRRLPETIVCHELGVAGFDGTARFLPPAHPDHVSYRMIRIGAGAGAEDAVERPVLRLASLLRRLGHDRLDLLKLDVEGAEYEVLDDLLASGLDVRQILVEFHHRLPGFTLGDTRSALRRLLEAGYRIFHAAPRRNDYGLLRI